MAKNYFTRRTKPILVSVNKTGKWKVPLEVCCQLTIYKATLGLVGQHHQ